MDRGQTHNELLLECGKGRFSRIDVVVVRRDKVNFHFFDLMYASIVFEHLLSMTLWVGLYPRAARVARILVKAVIMAALFLLIY